MFFKGTVFSTVVKAIISSLSQDGLFISLKANYMLLVGRARYFEFNTRRLASNVVLAGPGKSRVVYTYRTYRQEDTRIWRGGWPSHHRLVQLKMVQDVEDLEWYHSNTNRHVAETLLMHNGNEGTYLLRDSSLEGGLALSVRFKDSVKHFDISWDGHVYKFGMAEFTSIQHFVEHFENRPLLAADSGMLTMLKYPYPCDIAEPGPYDMIRVHATFGKQMHISQTPQTTLSLGSKEGYLTKRGGCIKTWKTRWFVLAKNELRYFRERTDKEPIRILDLRECTECDREFAVGKENCFKLIFPWRVFLLYAVTEPELKEWIAIIRWKLDNFHKHL